MTSEDNNWSLKGSVHENVMFSPDAVSSSERFTRAASSTSGRAKKQILISNAADRSKAGALLAECFRAEVADQPAPETSYG